MILSDVFGCSDIIVIGLILLFVSMWICNRKEDSND